MGGKRHPGVPESLGPGARYAGRAKARGIIGSGTTSKSSQTRAPGSYPSCISSSNENLPPDLDRDLSTTVDVRRKLTVRTLPREGEAKIETAGLSISVAFVAGFGSCRCFLMVADVATTSSGTEPTREFRIAGCARFSFRRGSPVAFM